MATKLNLPANLHVLGLKEISDYLRAALSTTPHEDITAHLLATIKSGIYPPTIYKSWLCVSPIPSAIIAALSQTFSTSVRKVAIKTLWKRLRSNKLEKWKDTWEGIGGVPGLLKILSEASVEEVKLLCRCISWSIRDSDPLEKREAYTQLFKSLFSEKFADAEWKNPDDRKLDEFYEVVGKACTAEFIEHQAGEEGEYAYEWVEMRDKLVQKGYTGYLEYARIQRDLEGFPRAEEWTTLFIGLYPSYKTTAEDTPQALQFSQRLLESKIRETKPMKYAKNPKKFVDEVIYRLTRRAYRLRSPPETVKRILDLSLDFVEGGDKETAPVLLRRGTHDLLDLTLYAWTIAPEPETFGGYLRSFIRLYRLSAANGAYEFSSLILRVPMSLRYRLLTICMKEAIGGVDIDVDSDLKRSKIIINQRALDLFPAEVVYNLYTRLKAVNDGDTKFLCSLSPSPILSLMDLDNPSYIDSNIWEIYLFHRSGRQAEANELAEKCFTARKAEAATAGSTPEVRAARAKEALYYTIASGSPTLYAKGLEWILQRFIRDFSVVSTIFGEYTAEAKALVVGVPHILEGHYTVDSLSARIGESNALLEMVFENAFAGAKEPSFNIGTWSSSLKLIPWVILMRTKYSERVKRAFGVDDGVVYDILWKGLVELIIKIERKGLESGYKKLGLNTIKGVLNYEAPHASHIKLEKKPVSVYTFFDTLAKARDELWREVRLTRGGTTLPPVFPSGLPVQALIWPYTIPNPQLEAVAPYIYSRAVQAVYLKEEAEVPIATDEETWDSIGLFVDDFGAGLRLLVPESLKFAEKKARLKKILTHLITNLSTRLEQNEAGVFWKHHISKKSCNTWESHKYTATVNQIANEEGLDHWPTVPTDGTQAWNPREAILPSPTRELKMTYLDLSLSPPVENMFYGGYRGSQTYDDSANPKLERFTPKLPMQEDIWFSGRVERAKKDGAIREGQILSAILYLKEYFGVDDTILPDFPGRFLLSIPVKKGFVPKTTGVTAAIDALKAHLDSIPPRLIEGLVTAVTSTKTEDVSAVLKLIDLLTSGNTPSLATPFAISTVLRYPNHSSWHRQLLTSTHLSILSKSDAAECLVAFAEGMISIFEEGEKETSGEKRYVKITTIKQMCALLTHPAVSPTTAVEILSLLSGHSKHRDARQAILDSLIGILTDCTDDVLADKVLTSLEFIIPVAGNLKPSAPISEDLWKEAEEKCDVGVLNVRIEDIMQETLLKTICSRGALSESTFRWKKPFISRILEKVIEELRLQTKRYLNIFLQSHGLEKENIGDLGLVVIPANWNVWYDTCGANGSEGGVSCPKKIMEEFAEYMVFRVWLPQELVEFGKKLKQVEKDKKGLYRPGVRFWEEQYGWALPSHGGLGKLSALRMRKETFEKMGVERAQLREEMGKLLVSGLYFGV
ncbi:hypothetical protein TWF481_007722 [Arthrobotrys musiformis]|uniref:Uncharacterized protein n=1 Tax=Arthrobotrys musiformis TaxID=47236 RepID=A0AAV9WCD8_9PEZI